MRLAALATGAGVPMVDFAGRIAEVHTRAALLALADGKSVMLVAPELGRFPRAITFDAPEGLSLRALIAPDAAVAARGAVLRVVGAAFAIDLRAGLPWRSNLKGLWLDPGRNAVVRAYRTAHAALDADGRSDRLRHTAGATLDSMTEATRRHDVAAAERAISRLIGLGEGRTPAGDDYLIGYLAALWACSDASRSFAAKLGPQLAALTVQTEPLSRLYLEAAAAGEVSERIAAVAAGIVAGSDDAAIACAVAAALAVGHSSGAAAVLGLLQGCAACAERRLTPAPMRPSRPLCPPAARSARH